MTRNDLAKKRNEFLRKYNPDLQKRICANKDLCLFGNFPTLAQLNMTFGSNMSTAWLMTQLYNLSEFCGCRNKLGDNQLEDCATLIAQNYYYLKVSELMLFFYRFKLGMYGKMYGSVDPLVIMTAIRDFITYRSENIAEQEQKQLDERILNDRINACSYEEYKAMKQIKQ